jgi:hypothetical protein
MFRKGTDQDPQGYLNLFEIISSYTNGPLLVTDQGFVVKKDIAAGGYVSANQGELWLGSGRDDQLDVPKIVLFQSETSRVGGGGPLDIDAIPASATLPTKNDGKLVLLTVAYAGNPAGTIYRCFGDEPGGEWLPKGHFTEFPGNFDTLYITKCNSETPAHLDVGKLTTHGNITISKATPILQLKALSGDPIIEFYDTSTLKMNLAYSAAGDYFYLRDIPGSKDVFQATPAGQLSLPVPGPNAGLRIGQDVWLYRGNTNTLYVTMNIEPGYGCNTGYLGEGENYWFGLVARYVYYNTIGQFYDEYDDLAIAKLWGEKNQTIPKDYDPTKLKPPTDDPFKILKGNKEEANTEEFFETGKVNSFLMSCVKALAKKQDEHDALLLKLLNEVESIRDKIAS